jgi:N utilization substance protein B
VTRSRPSTRHRSREAALQVLYAIDLAAREKAPDVATAEAAFDAVSDHFELPEGAREFARELVCGVTLRRAALDGEIAAHTRNGRLERMAAVDRNVLRLAAYEILFGDTPPQVAIDEAVELARRFGGERSPGFVNGVLDALARGAQEARQ